MLLLAYGSLGGETLRANRADFHKLHKSYSFRADSDPFSTEQSPHPTELWPHVTELLPHATEFVPHTAEQGPHDTDWPHHATELLPHWEEAPPRDMRPPPARSRMPYSSASSNSVSLCPLTALPTPLAGALSQLSGTTAASPRSRMPWVVRICNLGILR